MSAILLNSHSHRRRSENPGDPHKAWEASATSITCPANTSLSAGSVTIGLRVSLYFSGTNRIAPPGGNTVSPGFVGFGFYPGSPQRRGPAEPDGMRRSIPDHGWR